MQSDLKRWYIDASEELSSAAEGGKPVEGLIDLYLLHSCMYEWRNIRYVFDVCRSTIRDRGMITVNQSVYFPVSE